MTQIPGEAPGKHFEDWALAAAGLLGPTIGPPIGPPDAEEPGSVSEAVASLLFPGLLGPIPPSGYPGLYEGGADPSGGILEVLYYAAFGPPVERPDPALRIFAVLDHEADADPALEVAGVLVGERKDRLLFSEPHLPLGEISCSNLDDLRRLHARILSAARRT